MRRTLAIYLALTAACGQQARAQADPDDGDDPASAAESSGGETPSDGEVPDDGDVDASPAVRAEDATAAAKVDAALIAAHERRELDMLAVAQQRNELAAVRGELDERLASIAGLEARIDELLGAGKLEREHRRERVDLLANLIATMSPQAAATMLAQMSDAQAQDLLFSVAQTDKRKAAKLIATMPPSRAAAIGQRYLTRDPVMPAAEAGGDGVTPQPAAPAMAADGPPSSPPAAPEPAAPTEESTP